MGRSPQFTLASKTKEALKESGALKNGKLKNFNYPPGLAKFYKFCIKSTLPKEMWNAIIPLVGEVSRYKNIDIDIKEFRIDLKGIVGKVKTISSSIKDFAQIQFNHLETDNKNFQIGLDFPDKLKDLIDDRIEVMPKLMVVLLDDAMKQLPDLNKNLNLMVIQTKKLEKLKEKDLTVGVELKEIEDWLINNKHFDTSAKVASMMSGTLEDLMSKLADASPRDLSVNVEVVGEGGGTEIMGHPVHLSLKILTQVLKFCKKACDSYIDFYNDYVIMARHLKVIDNQDKILKNQTEILNKLPQ